MPKEDEAARGFDRGATASCVTIPDTIIYQVVILEARTVGNPSILEGFLVIERPSIEDTAIRAAVHKSPSSFNGRPRRDVPICIIFVI
ncbi:MAG: hypothetical protein GTO08_09650 [Deltaproteobacteria bacterium]|nr:hypothetical protein [Deltaproteobacteria bacterium]